MSIKINQIYKRKGQDYYIIITGVKGGKYRAKVLTDKPGVYHGSHSIGQRDLKKLFELI